MSKPVHRAPPGPEPTVGTLAPTPQPADLAPVAKKPSPDESRRDRVAINAFQGLIAGMSPWCDPRDQYGREGPKGAVLAKYAYDYADYFLAERDKRNGADEVI